MNIPGPLSVSAVNLSRQQELDLHPFQRVTAHVLSVTGTTALLSIGGYPIVAQLASEEQAATLLPQQTAQFIVTQRTQDKITLKVKSDDQPQLSLARSIPQGPELAVRLLEQQKIPVSANHLIVARAVLKKHLAITPLLLNELSEALSALGSWGSEEAEMAAALKAAGLPVTSQSLALASRQAAQIGDSFARLLTKLTDMKGQDLPEDLLKQLNLNLQILDAMILKADGESSRLAEQIKAAVEKLGTSLENVVLEQMQNPGSFAENNLLPLVRLQQAFEQAGNNEHAHMISDFLEDLQRNQFLNVKADPAPGQGEWSEIGFAIQSAYQKSDEVFSSARLWITREPHGGSSEINPAYTRLILQVDLNPNETVEVDLSVVDKQIRTLVTAPDVSWCRQAQEELPEFEEALRGLGFTLRDAQIHLDTPHPFERLTISSGPPLMTIDIEA